MKSVTTRFRQSPEERAELEELRAWCEEDDLSGLLRRAIEALKEETGFDLRDVEPTSIADGTASAVQAERNAALTQVTEAAVRSELPAFVPGFRPQREGK